MALAVTAYGLSALVDKPAAALGQPGVGALALITPNPEMRDKCFQSCITTFPDKYSAQYRACVKGCE